MVMNPKFSNRCLKFGHSILIKYLHKNFKEISYECRNGVFGSQELDIRSCLGTKLQAPVDQLTNIDSPVKASTILFLR